MADIYDYPYQYLYLRDAFQGKELPTEFSYKPGEVSYIVQKPELLAQLPPAPTKPEVIFYVVSKPEYSEFLERWWGDQKFGEITEEIQLSSDVTLYVATPASASAEPAK